VVGLDVVEEYCDAAEMFTGKVGLSDKVTFRAGDMLDLPFEESAFDVVWSQHVTMNIEDKTRMLQEIRRVLRPGGMYVLYEITAGSTSPIHYPVPWAGDSTINFQVTPGEFRQMLQDSGFKTLVWKDVSAISLDWARGLIANMLSRPKDASPPLGLNLLMGKTTPQKVKNMTLNLEEDRVRVVQAVMANA
jgi:SAM-dependent methyltransferase